MRVEEALTVLEKRNHVYSLGLEVPEPLPDCYVAFAEPLVLFPNHEVLVILVNAVHALCRNSHREDDFENRRSVITVKKSCHVKRAGNAFKSFEENFRFRLLDFGVRNAEREENVFPQAELAEKRRVLGEKLFHDEVVRLLSLAIPHLLVAPEMRESVIRFLDLVLAVQDRAFRKKRRVHVVRMLRAHAARNLCHDAKISRTRNLSVADN
ncbi:Uncharacterised protein [uncultured archaeon]|nr:Uncharacterised protein [uncultured archaeon]